MIHDLNVLHPQRFCPLFDDSFRLSSKSIVELDEVPVVAIEPFAFPSVQFAYFLV